MMGSPHLRSEAPRAQILVEQMPYWDSDLSTPITIRRMCELIHKSAHYPRFAGAAARVAYRWGRMQSPVLQFQRLPDASRKMAAVAIADWFFTKHFIKFAQDQDLTRRLLGYPDALEALMAPEVMIEIAWPDWPAGDCDCFTMFICALLECQGGIDWEIVTLACSRRQPGVWSHVYPRAVIGGMRLPLDASHGHYPGWSVPASDITRMAVYDSRGNLVSPGGLAEDEEVM